MFSFMRGVSFRVAGTRLSMLADKNNKWIWLEKNIIAMQYIHTSCPKEQRKHVKWLFFLLYNVYKIILPYRWLSDQQINRHIFLLYTYLIFLAIKCLFIKKKNPYILAFEIWCFVISLYRTLYFKKVNTV